MHNTSPAATSTAVPSTVQVETPSRPYTVSSKRSWLCGAGIRPRAWMLASKTATLPPESVPVTRNRTAVSPTRISSPLIFDTLANAPRRSHALLAQSDSGLRFETVRVLMSRSARDREVTVLYCVTWTYTSPPDLTATAIRNQFDNVAGNYL